MRKVHRTLRTLAELPRAVRTALVVVLDVLICIVSAVLAFWLRLGEWRLFWSDVAEFVAIAVPIWLAVAFLSGTYRSIVRFSGRQTVTHLLVSCVALSVVLTGILLSLRLEGIPRTLAVLHPIILWLALGGQRLLLASLLQQAFLSRRSFKGKTRVLIYGAGPAGQQLAISIRADSNIHVVGFVDESELLQGRRLEGRTIWHTSDLERVLRLQKIDEFFLALSTSRSMRRKIVERVHRGPAGIRVRALPSVSDLTCGKVTVSDLREVQIEELLGRDEVAPNPELMSQNVTDKCVLITGAGGSIGSELCRQILLQNPRRLILVEQSELALYLIESELRELQRACGGSAQIVPVLADIANVADCERVFSEGQPETVFHAAAYKHVPLLELNPLAGIHNNIIGTLNCCFAAEEAGTSSFILVSTDKAVRPTSVMGASKRVCEQVVQARAAAQGTTLYSGVRFGNVLGSSGSVVPLFRQQIAAGGPVTITHRDVTRYFMTIPEAAQLVIQAGALAEGGDIFLLDMGEPVRIYDLAKAMIELSGLTVSCGANPDGDIEIVEVGLRPGEKLYEELLIDKQSVPTPHPRIVRAHEFFIQWSALAPRIDDLRCCTERTDIAGSIEILRQLVPGFRGAVREHLAAAEVVRPAAEALRQGKNTVA